MFWLRAIAKPRYLRGFEPLLGKITVFTVFCGPGLAKTLVFTQFLHVGRSFFLDAKGTKTLSITRFLRVDSTKTGKFTKSRPKNVQQGPPKRIFKDVKAQKCFNLQHFVTFEKRKIVRKMCQNGIFFPILGTLQTGGGLCS